MEYDYEKMSFNELLKAAKKGDGWSQYLVGLEFSYPDDDKTPDYDSAAKWFKKSADDGYYAAMYELGYLYQQGHGVKESAKQAFKLFLEAAEDGELSIAMIMVGMYYGLGEDGVVEQDDEIAREWFQKAIDMDDENSDKAKECLEQLNEGSLGGEEEIGEDDYSEEEDDDVVEEENDEDDGEDEEDDEECNYDGDEGENGDGEAYLEKGISFEFKRDFESALYYYHKAMMEGDSDGAVCIAKLLANGRISPDYTDGKIALDFLSIAVQDDNTEGCRMMGEIFFKAGEIDLAIQVLKKGINLGSADCIAQLGVCYVNKIPAKAIDYYNDAISKGSRYGCYFKGLYLQNCDLESQAIPYLRKAAENGLPEAMAVLGISLSMGKGCAVNFQEAYQWLKKAYAFGNESVAEALETIKKYI